MCRLWPMVLLQDTLDGVLVYNNNIRVRHTVQSVWGRQREIEHNSCAYDVLDTRAWAPSSNFGTLY